MSTRVYSSISSNSWYDVRIGETGNGLHSNNEYYHDQMFADGRVCLTSDGRWGYSPPNARDYNRLYNKLLAKVNGGDQGELLTAAKEWRQSLDMVTKRTLWILDSYKSFRRFDLPSVVRKLSGPVAGPKRRHTVTRNSRGFQNFEKRKKVTNVRATVTETWLEYWMGWAPAMGDIFNALDVLGREFPNQHISVATGYNSGEQTRFNEPTHLGFTKVSRKGYVGCYADAQVTNYNLHLANQMGLVNPLLTGFQVIPFSFVLNWFVNVEQVLGSLTAFAGVSLSNTGIGIYQSREAQVSELLYYADWEGPNYVAKWRARNGSLSGTSKFRHPGTLPHPTLVTKFDRLALTRAATAVSLLVEIFLRKRD